MISAHALVRWLERVEGIDIPSVKREMRGMGLDANADGEILRFLQSSRGISLDAAQGRVSEALRQGKRSDDARYVFLPSAVLAVRGAAVLTVLTPEMCARMVA